MVTIGTPRAYMKSHAGDCEPRYANGYYIGGLTDWYSFDFGVRVLDGDVVEEEHAVEGLDEELDLVVISHIF
jgi:hypothetical protein